MIYGNNVVDFYLVAIVVVWVGFCWFVWFCIGGLFCLFCCDDCCVWGLLLLVFAYCCFLRVCFSNSFVWVGCVILCCVVVGVFVGFTCVVLFGFIELLGYCI